MYNLPGQEIKTLEDALHNTGEYTLLWNAMAEKNNLVCSGMYFYRLKTNEVNLQKKMLFIR